MNWLIDRFKNFSEKKGITDFTGKYNYFDLLSRIEKYNKIVDKKISEGETIAILSDYNFYSISLFLSLLNKKCITVPIASKQAKEIEKRLETASVDKAIKIDLKGDLSIKNYKKKKSDLKEKLIIKKRAGLILFSSGSTGEPKAMIHDLDNLIDTFKKKKPKNINILVFLMFDHIGGLNTLLNALSMGAHIVLPLNRKVSAIGKIIEKEKINLLPTSPTFLNLMLMDDIKNKFNLSSLKMITYGTELMPASLLLKLRKKFPKVRFLQTFGTSETGIIQTQSDSSESLKIKLKDPHQQFRIVNGELWLKSKTQILGYLNAKMDSFTKDGWFRTGDLVKEYKDGYIKIEGRVKEVINVGGEKVLPSEIESLLFEIPEILDCVAYGEKNSITGQAVAADIVLKKKVELKVMKKKIREFCIGKVSNYKIPAKIKIIRKTDFSDRFKKIRN